MTGMNSLLRKVSLFLIIALMFIIVSCPLPAKAQTTQPEVSETIMIDGLANLPYERRFGNSVNSLSSPKFFIAQTQPKVKPPRRRVRDRRSFWARLLGLGRRGTCNNLTPPLIALMPPLPPTTEESSAVLVEGIENALALTISAYPTFWFYVPDELQGKDFAEFMLQDEKEEDIFDRPIQVELKTSGIVSFKLPFKEKPLELNKPYHWYFSVICDFQRPSRNPSIDGWVERLPFDFNFERQLEVVKSEEELVKLYNTLVEKDIWYETLTLVSELYCNPPRNTRLKDYWPQLLQTLNLQELKNLGQKDYCPLKRTLQAVYDDATSGSVQRQSPTRT